MYLREDIQLQEGTNPMVQMNCAIFFFFRAAGVSQLFEAGVDEKVIQSRSGHRRLESLRMYERVTPAQEQAVSNVLSSRYRTDYQIEVQRSNSPVCLDPGPGVLPPMYSSSWRYNPVFAPHISSAQASQPSVPGMQSSNCTINIPRTS